MANGRDTDMRILVVEDDDLLADAVCSAFRRSSFTVEVAHNASTAAQYIQAMPAYDALILDLALPDGTGESILKALRQMKLRTPVLVMTARDQPEDVIKLLDLGADDYITKPFRLPVLEARVRALLRRTQWDSQNKVTFGSLTYDILGQRVYVDGVAIELTAKELGILELLLRRPGRIVSKDHIAGQVYDSSWAVNHNTIEVAVHRLRKKLEPCGLRIETIRGGGYSLTDNKRR
jgi:two-component system, OmpR family, response regulator